MKQRKSDKELRAWAIANKETVQLSDGREFDGEKMAALNSALSGKVAPDVQIPSESEAIDEAPDDTELEPEDDDKSEEVSLALVQLLREQNAALVEQMTVMSTRLAMMSSEIDALKSAPVKKDPVEWVHKHSLDRFGQIDQTISTPVMAKKE